MPMNKKEKMIERLRKIGSKGGKTTVKKHGLEHMSKIGKKGGDKLWGIT